MKNNFFLKFWYKLFNKQAYLDLKNTSRTELTIKLFKSKYEEQINQIQKKIKNQKKISFLHSGHIGDIINTLPIIKELARTHLCELYINIDKPLEVYHHAHQAGNVYINKKIYEMLLPLFQSQKYIDKVNIFTNQSIDINFDLIRDILMSIHRLFYRLCGSFSSNL